MTVGEIRTGSWFFTVTDLLLTFRGALSCLVPYIETAKIEWREGEAYDEWDDICEVLFNKMVIATLASALQERGFSPELPSYDMSIETYDGTSFIDVSSPFLTNGCRYAFLRFGSDKGLFDLVRCREVCNGDMRPVGELKSIPVEGTRFDLCFFESKETLVSVQGLSIEL